MGKQLNIRSDEAYDLAHKIAARENVTVSAAVVDALRKRSESMNLKHNVFSEALILRRMQKIDEFRKKILSESDQVFNEDHSSLYDENGLPK
jgi:hypothetical protein